MYAIGIDKIIAKKIYNNNINPIFYLSSTRLLHSIIDLSVLKSNCFSKIDDKFNIDKNYLCTKIETEYEKQIFTVMP